MVRQSPDKGTEASPVKGLNEAAFSIIPARVCMECTSSGDHWPADSIPASTFVVGPGCRELRSDHPLASLAQDSQSQKDMTIYGCHDDACRIRPMTAESLK